MNAAISLWVDLICFRAYLENTVIKIGDAMQYYFLMFLKYTLPGLVIAVFVVWVLWRRPFSKK